MSPKISLTGNTLQPGYALEACRRALYLSRFITGGGCHGFHYGCSFEQERADNNTPIAYIKNIVQPLSNKGYEYG